MSHVFSSLSSREFRKYVAAAILTALGTGMQFIAMSWFVYTATGSVASVAMILIVSSLPGMFLTPWIGILSDRWDNKLISVGADLARAGILLWMLLAIWLNRFMLETIYVTTFLMAVCNIFFQPAIGSLIRDISSRENLLNANIVSNMSLQIGMLAGASAGGILVAKFGVLTVITLNLSSFLISGALTMWIKKHETSDPQLARARLSVWGELRATLEYVRANRFIMWLAIVQMFGSATLYVCNTLLPAFVHRELDSGPEAFGFIDAGWGGGAIVGGLALACLSSVVSRRHLALFGPLLLSASIFLLLTSQGMVQAFAGYFALGFVVCVVRVSTDTELAAEVDRQYFGKVKSTITMFVSYISVGVYILLGWLGDLVSIRSIFLTLGSVILAGFLLGLALHVKPILAKKIE